MSWIQSDFQYTEPEPYIPCDWSSGTDEEIVEALEKHYAGEIDLTEYWSVGDERVVSLSAMSAYTWNKVTTEEHASQNITLVLSHIGGKTLTNPINSITECVFQVDQKDCLNETGIMSKSYYRGWANPNSDIRRRWCAATYYQAIPSTLRDIFKQFVEITEGYSKNAYISFRSEIDIFGTNTYSNYASGEGSQIQYYETSANKIKKVNGAEYRWWLKSKYKNDTYPCIVTDTGAGNYGNYQSLYGIAPFGVI